MGIFLALFLLLIFLVLILICLDLKERHYCESKGIHYYGNGGLNLFINAIKGSSIFEDVKFKYKSLKAKNIKVSAIHEFGIRSLIVTDVDLIKTILVKDFEHFTDRRAFSVAKKDVLWGKMLISLRGDKWKDLRSKLSPTFTTGKIKKMFEIFDKSAKKLVKFVEEELKREEGGEIEMTECFSKFTMDIIASVACGIDSKAFDQKEPALFERKAKEMQFEFAGIKLIKIMVMLMFPKLGNLLGFSLFSTESQDFFSEAITSSMEHRLRNNEKRDDFIQLMMEAREGNLKLEESELEAFEKDAIVKQGSKGLSSSKDDVLDDVGIVANCVQFILGGFDMTQSLLLFCAYSLAVNQDVQDKLREEVETILEENDGEFSYDSLNKMIYLDSVINETSRLYPPAAAVDRGCTQDWKVPGTDFTLKKGEGIFVPTYGFHHDPEIYPEPEKFDPERFSPKNKHKINPYTFLAFGQGPRNCIGMRFALAEVKIAIAQLVRNFKIEPSKRTLIPMKYDNKISLKPKGGMFLALNKIQY